MADYRWFIKRHLRSIDQLRLWNRNPRLNPDEEHKYLADYIEDLIQEDGDKANFMDLVRSIAINGFIPADPIVVWQDKSNEHYFVAEGNRRVLALKLLRAPDRAPREIRGTVSNLAKQWERIDKIYVNIAPSFEDAEWYISQRNSTSSIQKKWSRLQQMRWIEGLYEKYADNPDLLMQKTSMTLSEIEPLIRHIRLLNLVNEEYVKGALSLEEYRDATSHTFPITIFERFFNMAKVREKWGIDFEGTTIIFKNKAGFLAAFVQVIKGIVNPKASIKLDTRTVSADRIDDLLEKLPKVDMAIEDPFEVGGKDDAKPEQDPDMGSKSKPKPENSEKKGDLNRRHLILSIYHLNTSEARMFQMFNELKKLSVNSYVSVCAAAIRVFLDLAVLDYIQAAGLVNDIKAANGMDLRRILLKTRLDFLSRKSKLKDDQKVVKILKGLINDKERYSLEILNGYIHSKDTEYLNRQYINGFWDHIFPLLQAMLDITEDKH